MAEENIEQAAENTLLAAVMAPDVDEIDKPNLDPPQNLDEEEPEADEADAKDAKEVKAETEAEDEPEEDEVEIPGEDGKSTKRKLSEVVADAQAYAQFKGREREQLERIDREYATAAQQEYKQVRQFALETGSMIQAAMQLLQPPRQPVPPNPALMNQDYQRWEQENAQYQQAQWQYGNAMQQYQQAQALGGRLLQQANQAQARAEEERDLVAMNALERKGGWFAEFAKDDPKNPNGVRAEFATKMKAAYGYSWDELDAVLTDPRNLEVAQDALAFRAMKAKSGDVKVKVEAKAPKLTRTKTEAKSGGAEARDGKGRFIADAKARAMKSHSDDDWAAHFAGLVKAGRI